LWIATLSALPEGTKKCKGQVRVFWLHARIKAYEAYVHSQAHVHTQYTHAHLHVCCLHPDARANTCKNIQMCMHWHSWRPVCQTLMQAKTGTHNHMQGRDFSRTESIKSRHSSMGRSGTCMSAWLFFAIAYAMVNMRLFFCAWGLRAWSRANTHKHLCVLDWPPD